MKNEMNNKLIITALIIILCTCFTGCTSYDAKNMSLEQALVTVSQPPIPIFTKEEANTIINEEKHADDIKKKVSKKTKNTNNPINTKEPDKTNEPDATNIPKPSIKTTQLVKPTAIVKSAVPTIAYNTNTPTIARTSKPSSKGTESVTIMAVGDLLAHMPVINSGKNTDGTYNYDHLFANISEEINQADIAVINMETIMGGKNLGYSTFPRFNSPQEIGDGIVTAGFDVVLHATNHTLDKGDSAVATTLQFWEKYQNMITVLGIHTSNEDAYNINVVERNGIKIAMLNYTYGLNGLSMDSDKTWRVDMLSNKDKISDDIKRAKEIADVVIVFPHWGTEYSYIPNTQQKTMTKLFYDNGVNVVVGAHPHVLQPVEWYSEAGSDREMLVYYSLGNFISYQLEAARMLGGMAQFTIEKKDGEIKICEEAIIPIVTHFTSPVIDSNMTTYRLDEYSQELASIHNVNKKQTQGEFSLTQSINLAKQILGTWYRQ